MRKYHSALKPTARTLRKNLNKEERHLWYDFLRLYDVKFYRQRVIGRYIVDFYCPQAKLVVELDGSQHYDNDRSIEYDKERSNFLNRLGISVMRFTNKELHEQFRGICEMIDRFVRATQSESLSAESEMNFAESEMNFAESEMNFAEAEMNFAEAEMNFAEAEESPPC